MPCAPVFGRSTGVCPPISAVALTKKVSTNPRERKEKLVDDVQSAVDQYERMFVFEFDNMRSNYFKKLRVEWADSR